MNKELTKKKLTTLTESDLKILYRLVTDEINNRPDCFIESEDTSGAYTTLAAFFAGARDQH